MFISVHTEHASNFKDYKMKHPILNSYLSKQSKVKEKIILGGCFPISSYKKNDPSYVLEMSRDKRKFFEWMFICIIYVIICYQISYPIYEKYLRNI